jgi:hypothetical protein
VRSRTFTKIADRRHRVVINDIVGDIAVHERVPFRYLVECKVGGISPLIDLVALMICSIVVGIKPGGAPPELDV